ncbi:MAG TPA: FG-GAP-like repeat-containing protein, partial [Acidimicrobiia bacterium]|nr:FG-GAP-like repeat-containing protein [Acidimicrobiia bacterium]
PGVLAVSATTASGALASFSSYGWRVDVAAPGLNITSLLLDFDDYVVESGTSFSAPIVSGVAALLRSQNPSWTATQVADRIRMTARDVGPAGVDRAFGYGIVDPLGALGGSLAAPRPARRDGTDEPNDTPSRATTLALGSTRAAKIAPETDTDWYVLNVTTPGWYSITVPAGAPALDHFMDPVLELYDGNLAFQASTDLAGGALVAHIETVGPSYIKVRNRGGDTASYSIRATSIAAPGRFASTIALDFGADAQSTALGDVNGDGRTDLVFAFGDASLLPNSLVVLYQTPLRSYEFGAVLTTDATTGGGMAIGDLDNDADHVSDIALPVTNGVSVYARVNSGFGSVDLELVQTISTPSTPTQLAVADINDDNVNDLVAAGSFGINVYPGPAYNTPTLVTNVASSPTLAIGDVTGDGLLDVASCCVKVFPQNVDHTFAAPVTTEVSDAAHVAIGDVNGDTKSDVVASERTTPGAVSRLFQNAGALEPPATVATAAARPQPVAISDIDRDGRNDIVLLHNTSLLSPTPVRFGWMRQNPDTTLAAEQLISIDDFAASYDAHALAVGDADRDGSPDVAVATKYGFALTLQHSDPLPTLEGAWVQGVTPEALAENQSAAVVPTITFGREIVDADATTVRLVDAHGATIASQVTYDSGLRRATITPDAPLATGRYGIRVSGLHDDAANRLDDFGSSFIVGSLDTTAPQTSLTSPPTGYL